VVKLQFGQGVRHVEAAGGRLVITETQVTEAGTGTAHCTLVPVIALLEAIEGKAEGVVAVRLGDDGRGVGDLGIVKYNG
jgi:hypothetical protein